jgi:hypothetical protein
MSWKLESMKQLQMTNFFVIPSECKDPRPSNPSELDEMAEVTWEEDKNSSSTRQIRSVNKHKFKEQWCKAVVPRLCSAEAKGSADCF